MCWRKNKNIIKQIVISRLVVEQQNPQNISNGEIGDKGLSFLKTLNAVQKPQQNHQLRSSEKSIGLGFQFAAVTEDKIKRHLIPSSIGKGNWLS